jgi:hypothetical protein
MNLILGFQIFSNFVGTFLDRFPAQSTRLTNGQTFPLSIDKADNRNFFSPRRNDGSLIHKAGESKELSYLAMKDLLDQKAFRRKRC